MNTPEQIILSDNLLYLTEFKDAVKIPSNITVIIYDAVSHPRSCHKPFLIFLTSQYIVS